MTRLSLAAVLALGLAILPASDLLAQSTTAITETLGASISCPACPAAILTNITVLCNGSANCPEALNIDQSNSANLYGTNLPNCVLSTNSGVTWSQCISQPPLTGGASIAGVAATTNGTVLSAASTGSNCVIGRSTNATSSWTTVFNSTPLCQGDPGQSVIRCVGTTCIIGANTTPGGKLAVLSSTDDGQTWTVNYTSLLSGLAETIYWDGTNGIIQSNFRDSDHIIFTSTGLGGWTDTPNALAISLCYGVTSHPNYGLITVCTAAATRRYVNVVNGTVTNFTAPNLSNDGFPKVGTQGGNSYVGSNATSGCGFWFAQGGGTGLVQATSCNPSFNTIGGEQLVSGPKIYDTTRSNGVNAVLRVIQ